MVKGDGERVPALAVVVAGRYEVIIPAVVDDDAAFNHLFVRALAVVDETEIVLFHHNGNSVSGVEADTVYVEFLDKCGHRVFHPLPNLKAAIVEQFSIVPAAVTTVCRRTCDKAAV